MELIVKTVTAGETR